MKCHLPLEVHQGKQQVAPWNACQHVSRALSIRAHALPRWCRLVVNHRRPSLKLGERDCVQHAVGRCEQKVRTSRPVRPHSCGGAPFSQQLVSQKQPPAPRDAQRWLRQTMACKRHHCISRCDESCCASAQWGRAIRAE